MQKELTKSQKSLILNVSNDKEITIMRTYYKYYFHIIEKDNVAEYDFEAYFEDHMIADRFITENENDGNTVIMVAPFVEEVQMRPEDLPTI